MVGLGETKIWRKSIIILHAYRQLYSLRKNRRHLLTHDETRVDTSNDELNKPLSIGENKKVIGLRRMN